jgi:predicted nucleotidyltransferase
MWTFNGHFWALHISEKIRLVQNNPRRIVKYIHNLEQRINNNQSVEGCIIFGSLTRGKFHKYSDLDIVFSQKDGFFNAFCAFSVGVKERFLAFIYRIPIELYFYDSKDFSNTENDEIPLLIKDTNNNWQKKVPASVWLSQYPLLSEGFFK